MCFRTPAVILSCFRVGFFVFVFQCLNFLFCFLTEISLTLPGEEATKCTEKKRMECYYVSRGGGDYREE